MAFQQTAFQDNQFGFQMEVVGGALPVCDPAVKLIDVLGASLFTKPDDCVVHTGFYEEPSVVFDAIELYDGDLFSCDPLPEFGETLAAAILADSEGSVGMLITQGTARMVCA